MDNFDGSKLGAHDLNAPIPLDGPIPFESIGPGESGVSHAPLDLGGGSATQSPKAKAAAPRPAAKPSGLNVRSEKSAGKVVSGDRIVGMKTFFTKLHGGAIDFLEQQIIRWLKANPDVVVKRTNVVTGDVVGKKIEPNIIITIWY